MLIRFFGSHKAVQASDGIFGRDTRPDEADWVRRLNDAALRDEKGDELAGALKTVDSFL